MKTTYLNPDNRDYYRENWVRYFMVPALILAFYAVGIRIQDDSWFKKALLTISVGWGLQHIAFQNYGILSVYRGRAKATSDETTRRFEKAVFYLLFFLAAFEGILRMWLGGASAVTYIAMISRGLQVSLALVTLSYLIRLFMVRKIHPLPLPALLFFATAVVSTVYWPIYNRFGGPEVGNQIYFYVFNGHHCLCYLGLTYLMDCNQKQNRDPARRFDDGLGAFTKFMILLFIISSVLMFVGFAGVDLPWKRALTTEFLKSLGVLDGFFVMHYYLESNHWKFKRPHLRKTILPLLRQPVRVAAT